MRISDWSSDVCSSDLGGDVVRVGLQRARIGLRQQVGAAQAFVVAQQLAHVFGHVAHGGGFAFHHVRVERGRAAHGLAGVVDDERSEENTSELQSLMRSSYAVFCVKKHTLCKNSKQ